MSGAPALARRQQQLEELGAAALRALAGDGRLHYRGGQVHLDRERLPWFAAHLHPSPAFDDLGSYRGAADALALRLTHSDTALHRARQPGDALQALLFDLLEQLRVESQVPAHWPGVARNLVHRFEAWASGYAAAGLADTPGGRTWLAFTLMARSWICTLPAPEDCDDLVESARATLSAALGPQVAALRRLRDDQAAFASAALDVVRRAAPLLAADGPAAALRTGDSRELLRHAYGLRLEAVGEDDEPGGAAVVLGPSRHWEAGAGRYRVWTTAYDRELQAAQMMRPQQAQELRARLDRRGAGLGLNLQRLARELKALLARPRRDGWDDAQEDGRIDGRRLARLVAAPSDHALFRRERIVPSCDAVVSLLVDCSGSMKAHGETLALLADALSRALERAGARCEVLGFSTGAWDGGRAQRDWIRAGRPGAPGRLNERLHLVFKDAVSPWRRGRLGIAGLARPELYRESLDGEAVDWACARLRAREESTRLLIVVSDGCPMDRATQRAQDEHYLDQHLADVVRRQSRDGAVRILGLGVGLDLSAFYPRSQAVDLSPGLTPALLRDLLRLVAGRHRR